MFIFIISFKQLTYNSSIFFILISYISEVHSILIFVYPAYQVHFPLLLFNSGTVSPISFSIVLEFIGFTYTEIYFETKVFCP